MSKPLSRATNTWGIMRSVWAVNRRLEAEGRSEGATIHEIMEHALGHREEPVTYIAVSQFLRELEAKDMVVSTKRGNRLFYRPALSEIAAVAAEIRTFLDHVIHDDPQLLDELERQLLDRRYELEDRDRQRVKKRDESGTKETG